MSSEESEFKHTEAGLIPEEWRISTLSELATKITKGTTPTTIGGRFVDNGINFVKVESLNDDGTISKEKFMHIDEETNELLSRSKLQINDLLYSIAGTIGRVSIVTGDILPANTNQAVAIIRPNLGKINLHYLRYALVNPKLKNYLLSKVVHAVQANLSLTEIGNCPIPIPKPREQQSIAKILSGLDSKIELNKQMNKTLEAIGQAVFRRWFVDFEFPNEEGKPYKSSGGEMDSSDFGEKPHRWNLKPFSEVIAVNPPRKLEKNVIAKKVEMSDLNPWQPWIESWGKDNYKSGSRFKNGDTLFARITPCLENGKTALVSFLGENEVAFGSTEFIVLSPKNIRSSYFILYLVISRELRGSAVLSMTGSSGRQRVPNDFFDNFVIAVPPDELLRKYDSFVAPMFEKITNNTRESQSLIAIRDNLLPRLMSGKIRVPVSKENMETS
jgi:type I restriction enzyme S subunit